MAVNRTFLEGPHPVVGPYVVGREKIREFAAAIGSAAPEHHDVDAARRLGYADLVAPPTFAVVMTMGAEQDVVRNPSAGVDWTRVVHREQRFVHHRPVVAGDSLHTRVDPSDVREVAGNDLVSCRTDVVDADGTPVVTAHSVLVVRGGDSPSGGGDVAPGGNEEVSR